MEEFTDKKIISSWYKNVKPWVRAVRDGKIESRELVTNQAIVEAVLNVSPKTVLDAGCGEGWLSRELSKTGIECLGVDVVPDLIEYAQHGGGGEFKVLSYEDFNFDALKTTFDAIVCNFSLLGKESVKQVFKKSTSLLNEGGVLIVQTIHPVSGCGDNAYEDGWRKGSWFSDEFNDPAPWYFRTIDSWKRMYRENGFNLRQIIEPLDNNKQPASIIFVGEVIV